MSWRVAILIAVLSPGVASAQDAAANWPALVSSRLSTVYVLDNAGTETSGKFLRLNPDSIVLLVDGAERRFETARVARSQKRGDPLRNGAIIGAVVGVAMGIITAGISDCPRGDHPGGGCPGSRAALFLVSTGIYSAIGTGIDALIPGADDAGRGAESPTGGGWWRIRGTCVSPARGLTEPARSLVEMICRRSRRELLASWRTNSRVTASPRRAAPPAALWDAAVPGAPRRTVRTYRQPSSQLPVQLGQDAPGGNMESPSPPPSTRH